MNKRLLTYMGVEASISLVANALINGMIAYFLHRKSGYVAVDWISLAIDIVITSLFIGAFNASSAASSLKKNKAANILTSKNSLINSMMQIFQKPVWFGILAGICFMPVIFVLSLSLFSLLGVVQIALWDYVLYKSAYTGLLGASIVILSLYSGMHKASA
jgi:hypothetical protein